MSIPRTPPPQPASHIGCGDYRHVRTRRSDGLEQEGSAGIGPNAMCGAGQARQAWAEGYEQGALDEADSLGEDFLGIEEPTPNPYPEILP